LANTGMKSKASRRFWKLYDELPQEIQKLALKNYRLWQQNQQHPSLAFKKLQGSQTRFSVRVGDHYRALGQITDDGIEWVWIGSHENYNKLIGR
jgi:hypothetical protein